MPIGRVSSHSSHVSSAHAHTPSRFQSLRQNVASRLTTALKAVNPFKKSALEAGDQAKTKREVEKGDAKKASWMRTLTLKRQEKKQQDDMGLAKTAQPKGDAVKTADLKAHNDVKKPLPATPPIEGSHSPTHFDAPPSYPEAVGAATPHVATPHTTSAALATPHPEGHPHTGTTPPAGDGNGNQTPVQNKPNENKTEDDKEKKSKLGWVEGAVQGAAGLGSLGVAGATIFSSTAQSASNATAQIAQAQNVESQNELAITKDNAMTEIDMAKGYQEMTNAAGDLMSTISKGLT